MAAGVNPGPQPGQQNGNWFEGAPEAPPPLAERVEEVLKGVAHQMIDNSVPQVIAGVNDSANQSEAKSQDSANWSDAKMPEELAEASHVVANSSTYVATRINQDLNQQTLQQIHLMRLK